MLTIALTTAITVLVVAYLYRKWTFWSRQGQVQDVLAMFGVMNKPFHEMDVLAIKRSKKKVVGIYEFLQPALLVADAEVAKQVMVTDFHNFTHRKILQREEGHFSHSLFTARDDLWKRLRSTISPSFSPLKLKTLQPLMEESIASLVKRFKEESGQQDGVVDILHYYCLFAMDIILSCAFGTYADVMKNPDSEIARHGKNFLSRDISWETMFVITFPDIAIKLLNMNAIPHGPAGFFAQLTASVVKQRTHDASMSKPDWIHFMMNSKNEADGSVLSVKEISDNGIAFFVAGFDTSAHTLTYLTYLLALNPDKQEKLHAEIDAFYARSPDLTYDRLSELTYMDAVVNETFRMMLPVPRTMRQASQDCHLGDTFVPKGTTVWISNYAIHNDPDYFERPGEFLPERFLPGNGGLRHNDAAFMPFALGPRNCIGMRFALLTIKLTVVNMFRKLAFARCPETKVPLDYYTAQVVMGAKDVRVKVAVR